MREVASRGIHHIRQGNAKHAHHVVAVWRPLFNSMSWYAPPGDPSPISPKEEGRELRVRFEEMHHTRVVRRRWTLEK